MGGDILSLTPHAFVTWSGTNWPLHYFRNATASINGSPGSSNRIVTLLRAGTLKFFFSIPSTGKIFIFAKTSTLSQGTIQLSYWLGTGEYMYGNKDPGTCSWSLKLFILGLKNTWNYTSKFLYTFLAWCSINHTDAFTFTLLRLIAVYALCETRGSHGPDCGGYFLVERGTMYSRREALPSYFGQKSVGCNATKPDR
jgi:hypothetical protein